MPHTTFSPRVGMTCDSWISFTPTLGAETTAPTLGSSGVARGRYINLSDGLWWANIYFRFDGTGITQGSGLYHIVLPQSTYREAGRNPIAGYGTIYEPDPLFGPGAHRLVMCGPAQTGSPERVFLALGHLPKTASWGVTNPDDLYTIDVATATLADVRRTLGTVIRKFHDPLPFETDYVEANNPWQWRAGCFISVNLFGERYW